MNHTVAGLWWHEGKIPKPFFHGQSRRGWSYESLNGDLEIKEKDQGIVGGCLLDGEGHRWKVEGYLIVNENGQGTLRFKATFHDSFLNENFTIHACLVENGGIWQGIFKFEVAHEPQPQENVANALLIAFPPIPLA